MKDMVKTGYVKENIGDTEVRPIYSEQLFKALEQSYKGLKKEQKSQKKELIVKEFETIENIDEEDKISFLEMLKNQALRLQARIDFHSTKTGRRICEESLKRALCVNIKENKETKRRVSIEIVKYLQNVLKNLNCYDEHKIRSEINSIDQLKNLILIHSIEEQQKVVECMNEVRSKLVEKLFEIKKEEQSIIKKKQYH